MSALCPTTTTGTTTRRLFYGPLTGVTGAKGTHAAADAAADDDDDDDSAAGVGGNGAGADDASASAADQLAPPNESDGANSDGSGDGDVMHPRGLNFERKRPKGKFGEQAAAETLEEKKARKQAVKKVCIHIYIYHKN